MKELFRALDPTRWAALGAVVLLLILVVFLIGRCSGGDETRQANAGKTLSDGRTAAAQDASAVRDRADERNNATTSAVKDATDEIRNAPDPASRDRAALRGLCRIDPSVSPDCRMLNADSGRVD